MAKIDNLVQDFLAQKKIAVVGVSDKRDTGCNLNYTKFKDAGYQVYAVNPRITTYEGAPCYADLKSIPEKPDAVFIMTNPKVAEQIVQQCVDLGIATPPPLREVWDLASPTRFTNQLLFPPWWNGRHTTLKMSRQWHPGSNPGGGTMVL